MVDSPRPIAAVLIARNEGERFRLSLESLLNQNLRLIVYVDSGSTDGSLEFAYEKGIEVIELDTSNEPFTHSRARNEGFERVEELAPDVKYVQFLDGDCAVFDDWFSAGQEFLDTHPDYVSVCGKRLERNPQDSIYNTQISMEWQGEYGEVIACGGDFLIRREAFAAIDGFNPEFINGEDPELFIRLKKAGGRFYRLDRPMTEHDVNMKAFGQWWTRSYRCGHGYAHIYDVHGKLPQRYRRKQVFSSIAYGAVLPAIALLAILVALLSPVELLGKASLLLLGLIILLYLRMAMASAKYRLRQGNTLKESIIYAGFTTLAKPAHLLGIFTYLKKRWAGKGFEVIEYQSERKSD